MRSGKAVAVAVVAVFMAEVVLAQQKPSPIRTGDKGRLMLASDFAMPAAGVSPPASTGAASGGDAPASREIANSIATAGSGAQEAPIVTITLQDGSVIIGRIVSEDDQQLFVLTGAGAEVRLPRTAVAKIEPQASGAVATPPTPAPGAGPRFRRHDPNATRLLFAPTGRPLGRGEAQVADAYALFPSFSYGLTNNLSFMAGMSWVPGIGLGDQMYFVAPRVAFEASQRVSFSGGVLYATALSDEDRVGAGIVFAVGTYGTRATSLTVGLGYGFVTEDGDLKLAHKPIVMLGGEVQLSDSVAVISENWLLPDTDWNSRPFSLAMRFFGDRLSVDAGFIFIGEVLEEGVPIPWVSFSFRFGRGKSAPAPHLRPIQASRTLAHASQR